MKTLALILLTAAPCLADPKPPLPLDTTKTVQVTEIARTDIEDGKQHLVFRYFVQRAPGGLSRREEILPDGTKSQVPVTLSDGKYFYAYNRASNTYSKESLPPFALEWHPQNIVNSLAWPPSALASTVLDGRKTLVCQSTRQWKLSGSAYFARLWIDAHTLLPCRKEEVWTINKKHRRFFRTDYSGWVLNAPLPPSTFQFTPPAGAKEAK